MTMTILERRLNAVPAFRMARTIRNLQRMQPKRILLANSKGGSGKSTLATNLACSYAHQGIATALIDHDPQGSSSQWLSLRSANLPPIHGIDAFRKSHGLVTSHWFNKLPREIERVIIDTPAGLSGQALKDRIKESDLIIVPVLPSPIDIHAVAQFIKEIFLSGCFQGKGKHLLVMANRVKENSQMFEKLDNFLNSLNLDKISFIRDTANYVRTAEHGLGVYDLPSSRNAKDHDQWDMILQCMEDRLGGEHCLQPRVVQQPVQTIIAENTQQYSLILNNVYN
jgi:chromosome partitioning protein